MIRYTIGLLAFVFSVAISAAGTCDHAFVAEGQALAAFGGISTSEPGFLSYYWAWGAEDTTNQGTDRASLFDSGGDLAVTSLLWANSTNCSQPIDATGLLVEAQTVDAGGKFALIAVQGSDVDLDFIQGGSLQSVAEAIPVPAVGSLSFGSDGGGGYVDVSLSWALPQSGFDLANVPTAVLAGFGVYYATVSSGGPFNNGDMTNFTRVGGASGAVPYVTDDSDTDDGWLPVSQQSCVVRVRGVSETYFLALSLVFDGSAAVSEPQVHAGAVETVFVSASSAPASTDPTIFTDGFESGGTSAWSSFVP